MLLKDINNAIRTNKNKPITIQASNTIIYDVFGARKFPGGQAGSIEPHTDLILDKRAGKKTNISFKQAPLSSLSKGNSRGLEAIVPGIVSKFMNTVLTKLKQMKLDEGDPVPPILGKLNESDKQRIFIGKTSTGGPVDFVYVGSQSTEYNEDAEVLTIDGQLIDPVTFIKKKTFYLSLRPLYDDQTFDFKTVVGGIPKIYGKSIDHKISESIISLTEDVNPDAVIVEIP
jgi:hypothetical protein